MLVTVGRGAGARTFPWGQAHEFGTAAYWVTESQRRPPAQSWALTATLTEEVVCCMLGGHGMPAEVGLAAFDAVRDAGLLGGTPSATEVEAVLRRPLVVGPAERRMNYRFPRQRARWVADALAALAGATPPTEARALRDGLVGLPGVGPKTASWIVRNHLGSGDVAIIDVHVRNAGVGAGFFSHHWQPARHYGFMEDAFLGVARRGGVSAAVLDAVIWATLHRHPRLVPLLVVRGRHSCDPLAQEVEPCPDETTRRRSPAARREAATPIPAPV